MQHSYPISPLYNFNVYKIIALIIINIILAVSSFRIALITESYLQSNHEY